jgi:hypothetical protein
LLKSILAAPPDPGNPHGARRTIVPATAACDADRQMHGIIDKVAEPVMWLRSIVTTAQSLSRSNGAA